MQIEVTPSGQRVTDKHGEDVILIDVFDKVLAEVAGISMDFTDPTALYVLDNVRLLRSGGNGVVYGIRVTVLRKTANRGKHVFMQEGM